MHTMKNPLCTQPSKISLTCADSPMKISPAQIYMPQEPIVGQRFDHKWFVSLGKLLKIFH